MGDVSETIALSDHLQPLRYGLKWMGIAFTLSMSFASLFLLSDVGDFMFVCIIGVPPVCLIAFAGAWSRTRELAKQSHSVTLSENYVTVDEARHELASCRWFKGWAFHQPQLTLYPAYSPAIVISWPPFTCECYAACGVNADCREAIVRKLQQSRAVEDLPRRRNERFLVNIATVTGSAATLLLLVAMQFTTGSNIPFVSLVITVLCGGVASRILARHKLGFIQFQTPPGKQISALLMLVLAGPLRMNRRWRGGPVLQDPSLFLWVLPLAVLQVGSLAAVYFWIRNREDVRLGVDALKRDPEQ